MNNLHEKGVYLAGAMEHAPPNYGEEWRAIVANVIRTKWDEPVFNPYEQEPVALKEFGYSHPKEWIPLRRGTSAEMEKYEEVMSKIIEYDIDLIVNKTSLVVCKWDKYARMGGGTNAELTFAFHNNIPVITLIDDNMSDIPGWLLPCMGAKVFNMTDLLIEIDKFFQGQIRRQ